MSNHQKIYVYFDHNTEIPEPLGTITVQQKPHIRHMQGG